MSDELTLRWLPGRFAVCRLAADASVPDWAAGPAELVSITRTADELSIIAPQDRVPTDATAERDFAALRVVGTLEFSTVGVLAKLTAALADGGIPGIAVSTYDTDYLLVKRSDRISAESALSAVANVKV